MTTPAPAQIKAARSAISKILFEIGIDSEAMAKAALTAAAEAGEQDEQVSRLIGFTQFDLDKDRKRVEAATIERCKRVIRAYNPHREWALVTMQKLIAALDRMKDEA